MAITASLTMTISLGCVVGSKVAPGTPKEMHRMEKQRQSQPIPPALEQREIALLTAFRGLNTHQQRALLNIARGMARLPE